MRHRRKDSETYVVVFESEEALADYERCNEILYGPEVSAEGYARASETDVDEWPVVVTGPARPPRRPRSDFTRRSRRSRRG